MQDASRKRTSPSQAPGPWAGTVTHTIGGRICGTVSQEKWDKTKRLICEMAAMVECERLMLGRLLQIRRFLMYVVRTYPWINPYMKGLHLTIDSWRPFRGPDGFKLRGKELENALACGVDDGLPCRRADDDDDNCPPGDAANLGAAAVKGGKPPLEVEPVPRFLDDLVYLQELVESDTPPQQLYRAKHSRESKGGCGCDTVWSRLRVGSVVTALETEIVKRKGGQEFDRQDRAPVERLQREWKS